MYIYQIDFAFKLNYKNLTFVSNLDLFQIFSYFKHSTAHNIQSFFILIGD